ncbi:hypothetical protein FGO68_gene1145 [Halteria grandinella]|uniref:Transmembrane protein n=1 Tax=Halteria grandinella TaxID=5974 RepID=A0A8J8T4E8_HALGN|nr:hypothetical protein FGO68_gene1145 [Halteria grandinella]
MPMISIQIYKMKHFNTKQIRKHIKSLDNFGIPIAFTYKKSTHVKSFTGGLMTLIAYCLVFAFFLYQCKNVFVRDFSLQTLTTKRDLQYNSDIINVTQKELDFGIRLEYYLREFEPEVQKNLDQYVEVSVSQNVYTWKLDQQGLPIFDKQKQTTELIPCQIGRLGSSKNKKDYLNLEADYLCPKDVNYQIQGSFSGEVSRFIQIAVKSCNQAALNKKYNNTKKCVSESETMRIAAQLKLYLLMENSYFDESNFDGDYIKKFLKPYYLTSLYNQSIYYYMTLSQNKIQMNDNIFYSFNEPRLAQTFETQIDYNVVSDVMSYDGSKRAFIGVYIQMDESRSAQIRRVTSFLDAFSNTGGIITIIMGAVSVLISNVSNVKYFSSLISTFYWVDSNHTPADGPLVKPQPLTSSQTLSDLTQFDETTRNTNLPQMRRFRLPQSTLLASLFCLKPKNKLFNSGVSKILDSDLDIVNCLKRMKQAEILFEMVLKEGQRKLVEMYDKSCFGLVSHPMENVPTVQKRNSNGFQKDNMTIFDQVWEMKVMERLGNKIIDSQIGQISSSKEDQSQDQLQALDLSVLSGRQSKQFFTFGQLKGKKRSLKRLDNFEIADTNTTFPSTIQNKDSTNLPSIEQKPMNILSLADDEQYLSR